MKRRKSNRLIRLNRFFYFSRETERRFFFIMTLFMMIMGLIVKWIE